MTENTQDDGLSQTYLQISPNILESFPKFRPPVDLYFFDQGIAQVKKIHKAEERLATEKQAQVAGFSRDSLLYLLRDDYRVYAQHLSKRLGLVLVEDDFKPQEVAEIFFLAFRDHMNAFLEQPKEGPLKVLVKDISILAEYLWADPCRVEFLTKTLHKDYSLAVHSVNTMLIGLALFAMASQGKLDRGDLISLALGLILHDLGMTNVPKFIVDKEQYLVRRDRDSIEKHIEAGERMLKRLDIGDAIVVECITQHHERTDGSGYPERRKGSAISMAGKLCAVADSFSAIIGDRPYHDAKVFNDAAATLAKDTKRYEPILTKLLVTLIIEGWSTCKTPDRTANPV